MHKVRVAIERGATCSGCDVAILDLHERLLEVLERVEIVSAPTLMDAKHEDLKKMPRGGVDVCFYHGAIRTSENEELAKLLRKKSKLMVAFGSCACFGGVPGLANLYERREILEEVYVNTLTTENPRGSMPSTSFIDEQGNVLSLPEFLDDLKTLDEVVDVDYYLPFCPPPAELIEKALDALLAGNLPPKGSFIASQSNVCKECERERSRPRVVRKLKRLANVQPEVDRCFLEQGLLCLGPATRGGCKAVCIDANAPCRGCGGPLEVDQCAGIYSAIATCIEPEAERRSEEEVEELMGELFDPIGYGCRFTYPKSLLSKLR